MFRKFSDKFFGSNSGTRDTKGKLVAVNENNKELNLSPKVSKVFGMPDSITSNLAYDKYQSLLAVGTKKHTIKIISLKGYEFEIH